MSIDPCVDLPADIVFPLRNRTKLALEDFKAGLIRWQTWVILAYHDIKLRYRRSVLGPFWITISMAITVYTMGYLYGYLLHAGLQSYLPYLAGGMITWALISCLITDLTDAIILSDNLIKQVKQPYSLYIHRVVARNIFIFLHNIIVMIPILIFFHHVYSINWCTLFLIPGLFMIYVNAIFYGTILAMVGARFRDVAQIIKSLVQVTFFLTPVMWRADALPANKKFIVMLNPFSSFIEIVRAPLLGSLPQLHDIMMVLIVTLLGMLLCYKMFVPYRARIVYWL